MKKKYQCSMFRQDFFGPPLFFPCGFFFRCSKKWAPPKEGRSNGAQERGQFDKPTNKANRPRLQRQKDKEKRRLPFSFLSAAKPTGHGTVRVAVVVVVGLVCDMFATNKSLIQYNFKHQDVGQKGENCW